jgi:hypothetical protein
MGVRLHVLLRNDLYVMAVAAYTVQLTSHGEITKLSIGHKPITVPQPAIIFAPTPTVCITDDSKRTSDARGGRGGVRLGGRLFVRLLQSAKPSAFVVREDSRI